MNIILIISDTLRKDYLGCYGNDWVRTPHIDALAEQSMKFTHFFAASFPTRPMRKDVHSGRFTFPYTGWGGDWNRGEIVLAEVLKKKGYTTALIGDTGSNRGFERGFDHFEIFTGQGPAACELTKKHKLPAPLKKLRTPAARLQRIKEFESHWKGEEDTFVAQTMRAGARWLETQYKAKKPFFLFLDTFDPHEPWNPPRYYIDMYDPGYSGHELFEPAYWTAEYATEREIHHMRCMYAGEVTLVDRWIGYLLERVRDVSPPEETAIILTSDHGFYHGEHNLIGKIQLDRKGLKCRRWPLYNTIAQAPLLIQAPGVPSGKGSCALCQPPDLMPTILDLAGAKTPRTVQGVSVLPAAQGKTRKLRDCAITSGTYIQDREVRCPSSFRTHRYLYIYGGDEWGSELYDLRADPDETHNIFHENEAVARRLHKQYLKLLREIECPQEVIELRTEFNPKPRPDLPYDRAL